MYTDLQQKVIARAKELLNGRPVCLDQLQRDSDIQRDGIEDCAHDLYVDTIYWEGDFIP